MDPHRLSRADLVDFTTNAATGVADGKVSGFSAPQNTAISDALTDANTVLAAANLAVVEARAASKEATQIAIDAEAEVHRVRQRGRQADRAEHLVQVISRRRVRRRRDALTSQVGEL